MKSDGSYRWKNYQGVGTPLFLGEGPGVRSLISE